MAKPDTRVEFGAKSITNEETGTTVHVPIIEIVGLSKDPITYEANIALATEDEAKEFCLDIFSIMDGEKHNVQVYHKESELN